MSIKPFRIKQSISYHADFFVPDDAKQELLVCLHGNGQSKETAMTYAQRIHSDWSIAALQGPYPHVNWQQGKLDTQFSWVSDFEPQEAIENHHQFLISVIEKAYEDKLINHKKAVLFGFSQSVSLNYRFAKAHPDYVKGVIAIAGAAPTNWPEETQSKSLKSPILHIAMTEDEAYSLERSRQFKTKLECHANNLTWLELEGGHRVPRAAYGNIKTWLEGLEV